MSVSLLPRLGLPLSGAMTSTSAVWNRAPSVVHPPLVVTTSVRFKGHSKWQNIRRKKGIRDQKIAKMKSYYSNRIIALIRVRLCRSFNCVADKRK